MSDDVAENDTVTASDARHGVVDDRSEPERQRDEYLDALQRLQADFENYRKRVARSSMDAADRAAGEVVVKMLPVLDAFDSPRSTSRVPRPKRPRPWIRRGDYYSTHSRRRDWSESTPWVSSSTRKYTTRSPTLRVMTALWSIRCFAPGTAGRVRSYVPQW